ncbi:phosphate ABC transporter substrate-binding protein, PhoT family [Thermoanaerobacter uzonensis DSM 18761]|uniref:Phosphate-binding protein n=1 Tax=Thermoanaerobacter uzonensis DSM 18761 TaxID=1123369 RepID=A0A1M4WV14_9THEO|nr:phosphate ABC transporter substrate-binding protein [Thermoanaerobacter uzonensis]SHE85131.1 phosphate ABC transporter substrate-binding protein, PhoT family [Thermoanaerobacter uzonensis DSM 18761]
MVNSRFAKLAIAVLLITSLFSFAACGSKQPQSNNSSTSNNLSGNITIAGSTALQPLAEQAAKMFMEKYPNVAITVQGGGSGTGLTQVAQGAINIGNSDIFAEEKLDANTAKSLVDHKVAVVGFAVVVNKDVTVDNLTQQQLIDIFTGKITNWKDVGGPDEKITVILRPASSGTRATFKKIVLKGQDEVEGVALTEDSNGTVKKAVADTKGAISYIGLSYIDDTVKVLKYNGVDPTAQNIIDGKYPIWSYEHMYTKGEPTGAVKAFLDFMMSTEVQKGPLTKLGFIPITEMKAK